MVGGFRAARFCCLCRVSDASAEIHVDTAPDRRPRPSPAMAVQTASNDAAGPRLSLQKQDCKRRHADFHALEARAVERARAWSRKSGRLLRQGKRSQGWRACLGRRPAWVSRRTMDCVKFFASARVSDAVARHGLGPFVGAQVGRAQSCRHAGLRDRTQVRSAQRGPRASAQWTPLSPMEQQAKGSSRKANNHQNTYSSVAEAATPAASTFIGGRRRSADASGFRWTLEWREQLRTTVLRLLQLYMFTWAALPKICAIPATMARLICA